MFNGVMMNVMERTRGFTWLHISGSFDAQLVGDITIVKLRTFWL